MGAPPNTSFGRRAPSLLFDLFFAFDVVPITALVLQELSALKALTVKYLMFEPLEMGAAWLFRGLAEGET